MKTPREILLERHRSADRKLNAIREGALAAALRHAPLTRLGGAWTPPAAGHRILSTLFRELIQPARRIWTGLAASWLLIFLVNLRLSAGAPPITPSAGSVDFITALREQDQMMAWLAQPAEPKAAEPPKRFVPRPRSESCGKFFTI